MITINNIFSEYPKFEQSELPTALQSNEFEFVKENIDLYNDDETIKEYIDTFVAKLNEITEKSEEKNDEFVENLPKKTAKQKKEKAPKAKKEKVVKPKPILNIGELLYWPANDKEEDGITRVVKINWNKDHYLYSLVNEPNGKLITEYTDFDIEDFIDRGYADYDIPKDAMLRIMGAKKTAKQKKEKAPKAKKEKVVKPKKEKAAKPIKENIVAKMPLEVLFLKRYKNLDNKIITDKQLLSFIKSLQKAILEKQIRKSSVYASEIETIQKNLITAYREMQENVAKIELNQDSKERILQIINNFEIEKPVSIIKRFLSIQGRQGVEKQAKLLLKFIENNYSNYSDAEYGIALNAIKKALEEYLNKENKSLAISEATLKGLAGLAGCSYAGTKKKTALSGIQNDRINIINSTELARLDFKKAGWTGKWLKLIGDPVYPFSLMVWSKPGKGKSTLIIELSYYLASEKGKKILYISKDEGSSYTMQEKFNRLNAFHPNIDISSGIIPTDLSQYDYVVFDLMNDFDFKYDDFKTNYIEKYYPLGVSFISIFKTNISGEYRGNKDWENLFDVSIFINDEGVAKANKNRFGVFNEVKVF